MMKHPRHFIITILSFLLLIQVLAQKNKTENSFAGLDTAIARVLKDWHAAGCAVAVVEKNKVLYAKGFGYKDYENKTPVTANTLFAIGSCTKAFTASLLGMLNKDDKVDLDKPVSTYLPGLKFYNDEMTAKITLRDMMCHRTGLPRHDLSWYLFTTQSRDSLLQRIAYMEPSAGLREKWQYNNFMFMLQGLVVEKITGKSWEDNIREKIFAPLGMTGSDVSIDELTKSNDIAVGYNVKKDSIIHKMDYYHIDAMGPAGSINSSVTDMAKWVTAWINNGKVNGTEIIPAAYISQAISSQMVISGGLPEKETPESHLSNYGFGWIISSYYGHYRVQHGGNIDGFSANTCLFPSDSIAIIVLCNQNGSAVPTIVRNIIADRILKLKYRDWETQVKRDADKADSTNKQAEKTKTSSRKTGTHPSHDLKDYTGIYTNKGYGSFEVSAKGDSLFAQFGTHLWWLRHYHYDNFEPFEKDTKEGYDTTDHSDALQFNLNAAGDVESASFAFEPTLKPIQFVKTPKAKSISKDSLQKYAGEYLLGTVTLKVFIKDEKTLYLFVPDQPQYELVPVDTDKFSIKSLTGFTVQFNTDSKGNIIELLSIQPNGTFKATRKK
jgi:CubicO group peptidase (beta-lactamase class C family)